MPPLAPSSSTIREQEGDVHTSKSITKHPVDIKPASKGHTILFPKQHTPLLALLDDASAARLFVIANKLSTVLFEGMKAEGTNILASNGPAAGQFTNHAALHIIPRWKGDNITFSWKSLTLSEAELISFKKTLAGLAQQRLAAPQKKEEKPAPPEDSDDEPPEPFP